MACMERSLAGLLGFLLACGGVNTRYSAPEGPITAVDHRALSALLGRYVSDAGAVDYEAWKASAADVAALDRYLGQLTAASPDSHPALFATAAARLSYWINLYNAVVIREVLRRWPLESVRDVEPTLTSKWIRGKGFFYDLRFSVAGDTLNLRDLENKIIRDRFEDARIHFAINCASASCPVIGADSFEPGDLEARLEAATAAFVNQPGNVRVDEVGRAIRLSKIFEWYRGDFERDARARRMGNGRLIDFVRHYARGELRRRLDRAIERRWKLAFLDYDWSVNSGEATALATSNPALVGKPLPALELALADGTSISTASLRGKPLVLDFWASYCKPCRKKLPELADLAERRGDLQIIAVSLDDDPARARAFARELGVAGRLAIAFDPEQRSMEAPLAIRSLPGLIVVGADGVVRARL